jgi:hypothetical protein
LYNPKTLESARVGDAAYAKVTMPPEQVVGSSGKVKAGVWNDEFSKRSLRVHDGGDSASHFTLGFLRESGGWLRIFAPGGEKKPL